MKKYFQSLKIFFYVCLLTQTQMIKLKLNGATELPKIPVYPYVGKGKKDNRYYLVILPNMCMTLFDGAHTSPGRIIEDNTGGMQGFEFVPDAVLIITNET